MKSPKCENSHPDCFAFLFGKCICLSDTSFEGDCPFYKDRRKWDGYPEWLRMYGERVLRIAGGKDYVGTYH